MKFLLLIFTFSFNLFAASFSEFAWREAEPTYRAIRIHAFNEELRKGSLPQEKFHYYDQQDALYLSVFTKVLLRLASQLQDPAQIKTILKMAEDCISEKKQKGTVAVHEAKKMPANFMYSHYLLSTAAHEPPEVLAAALLPCFWIYLKLAEDLKKDVAPGNPYAQWVKMYSSNKYKNDVEAMVRIVNTLAKNSSEHIRERMLEAFLTASVLEWQFWDDAYNLRGWKSF